MKAKNCSGWWCFRDLFVHVAVDDVAARSDAAGGVAARGGAVGGIMAHGW